MSLNLTNRSFLASKITKQNWFQVDMKILKLPFELSTVLPSNFQLLSFYQLQLAKLPSSQTFLKADFSIAVFNGLWHHFELEVTTVFAKARVSFDGHRR